MQKIIGKRRLLVSNLKFKQKKRSILFIDGLIYINQMVIKEGILKDVINRKQLTTIKFETLRK